VEQEDPPPLTPGLEKADMSFSAPLFPQAGHSTSLSLLLEKLITSNSCLHFLHAYSKIGTIFSPSRLLDNF